MTDHNQKYQILESLNSLDQVQTDKVLEYIKSLLSPVNDDANYQRFKRQALREIRDALSKKRKPKTAF